MTTGWWSASRRSRIRLSASKSRSRSTSGAGGAPRMLDQDVALAGEQPLLAGGADDLGPRPQAGDPGAVRQLPHSTAGSGRAASIAASTRLVLPIPGSPVTSTRDPRPARAAANPPSSRASSRARPTRAGLGNPSFWRAARSHLAPSLQAPARAGGGGAMYDVIVIGARVGGSATGDAAGPRGLRVLAVDRAAFPSDKPCPPTRCSCPGSPGWRAGVLDGVIDSGAPPTRRVSFTMGDLSAGRVLAGARGRRRAVQPAAHGAGRAARRRRAAGPVRRCGTVRFAVRRS
jgi:hypothetical protein